MKKQSIILTSAFTLALTAALGANLAYADRGEGRGDCNPEVKQAMMKHHGDLGGDSLGGKRLKRKEMFEREYSANQIRTLTEARLIMQGNENLKVGKISSTESGYTIAIVTQDGSAVEEKKVAKNGMPIEMYEHIKARIAAGKEEEK